MANWSAMRLEQLASSFEYIIG